MKSLYLKKYNNRNYPNDVTASNNLSKIMKYIRKLKSEPNPKWLSWPTVLDILSTVLSTRSYNFQTFMTRNFKIKLKLSHRKPGKRHRYKLKMRIRSYPKSYWDKVIRQVLQRVFPGYDSGSLGHFYQYYLAKISKDYSVQKNEQLKIQHIQEINKQKEDKLKKINKRKRTKRTRARLQAIQKNLYLSKCQQQAANEIRIMRGEQ